jgi:hypothetical protein
MIVSIPEFFTTCKESINFSSFIILIYKESVNFSSFKIYKKSAHFTSFTVYKESQRKTNGIEIACDTPATAAVFSDVNLLRRNTRYYKVKHRASK